MVAPKECFWSIEAIDGIIEDFSINEGTERSLYFRKSIDMTRQTFAIPVAT